MTDPRADMEARWRPSQAAVDQAVAALASLPEADFAGVPMAQPGKGFGVWTTGQEVVTVEGQVFTGVNSFESGRAVPSWAVARNEASKAATKALAGRPGTVGYAAVSRDGTWAVFEDFPAREERTS